MRILVTGGAGQLARSLAECAGSRSGVELMTVGRPELDLEKPGSAERLIEDAAPDLVINAAAYTAVDQAEDEPDRAFRINADAAGEIAAAASRAAAPIVQISTDYVFDGRSDEPYGEEDSPNPLSVYGRSKLAGEERVRSANPRHMIVRTAWVYSPFGHNFLKSMMSAARTRESLTVVDDQFGSPTSAFELAGALLRAVQAPALPAGETYHLTATGRTSWCGFARAIMAESERLGLAAAEVQPISTAEWPTKAVRPTNSVLNCAKFERQFGFVMPPWQTPLGDVVKRLAENIAEDRLGA